MDLVVSLTHVFTMFMIPIHYRYPFLSTFDHLLIFIILPLTSISFHTFLFIYPKLHLSKVSECSYLIGPIITCLTFYLPANGFILIHGGMLFYHVYKPHFWSLIQFLVDIT